MRPDIIDLQAFYASRQGQLVRRLVGRQIRMLWPELPGARVLGMGYAVPYLGLLAEASERVCAIMPPAQGVCAWPANQPGQVALAMEGELPLPDRSVDRVLMVHALESAEQVRPLLREVWRVLVDGGEAMIVVPNRRGLWCLSESTPFGHGQPFSASQLKDALRGMLFSPGATARALYMPPSRSRLLLRTAVAWERVGLRWAEPFSGVLAMTAAKQIYALPSEPARKRRRKPAYTSVPQAAAAERVTPGGHRADIRPAARADAARTGPVRSTGC
jgi:SAM-dependent methyltransferase